MEAMSASIPFQVNVPEPGSVRVKFGCMPSSIAVCPATPVWFTVLTMSIPPKPLLYAVGPTSIRPVLPVGNCIEKFCPEVGAKVIAPASVNAAIPTLLSFITKSPVEVRSIYESTAVLAVIVKFPEAMLRLVSQPVPMLRAVPVNPVPSVTLAMFMPRTAQVPAAQAVNAGSTDIPLMVRVAAPDAALIVGERRIPFVVLVTAAVVASVKAKETSDPVSAP